jgi:predicted lipoprotein with Yx(FWY)xxD motif
MSKRTLTRIYVVAVGALAALAAVAAVALASGSRAPTVGSASNAKLGETVVVSAQGRTLYALSPETSRHLLCKSQECLQVWPPLTVSSDEAKLKAGAGVQGKLGLIRRGKDRFQVTLRGMPLYRFSGDHGRDESNGEGLKSFGGTWHAATSVSGATAKPTPPSAPPAPSMPAEPYASSTPAPTSSTPSTPAPTPTPTTPTTTTTTPTPPPYPYPTY